MRKLTKKISMLMVLAMLVGLFSGVVSASAASAWSFKSGKYNVAVNGEINMKKNEYADFDLLKDGKAPEGYTVVWKSSDEDVVWVNAKTGQLRADKAKKAEDGDKAVISATFTNTKTKKSATRSFTIVVGEVKAPVYTVEQADVTAELGDAIKFAPVVKNEAGEVVKFATHKSYNGYFLDGKAITNPWTPEAAGEYTVTVAQFASKADVADLTKAVRNDEFKVTVKADLAAEATGVKEITVYGDFAKDATFTVKKGTGIKVAFTATIAEDGKSATLALKNKITEGTYTVTYGDASVALNLKDEFAKTVTIVENGGIVNTSPDRTAVYVHYDVLNQYGESIRKTTTINPTGSTGITPDVNKVDGIVTIKAASGNTFIYGSTIILTLATNDGAFAAAEMTAGLENTVDTVKIAGITLGNTGKILEEIPASFIGAKGDDADAVAYYLLFQMVDRAGYVMDVKPGENQTEEQALAEAYKNLTFGNYNPGLIEKFDTRLVKKHIDGEEYLAIRIYPGLQVKKGGVAKLEIRSNKTGGMTPYELRVVSDQILAEFNILPYEDIIVKDTVKAASWARQTEITLAFEATDINGAAITDFRALYDRVQFSNPDVKLAEQNDGSAKLTYKVPTDINPTEKFDVPVVISAIVPEGKGNTVTLRIKEARYASTVESYQGGNTLLEGTSMDINLATSDPNAGNRIQVADQYDEVLEELAAFYPANNDRAMGFAVRIVSGDGKLSINGAAVPNQAYKYFAINDTLTLTAVKEVTDDYQSYVLEFSLVDRDKKIISGSTKTQVFYVADISQATSFSTFTKSWLGKDTLLQNRLEDSELAVNANLSNGASVGLSNRTIGAEKYYITFEGGASAYAAATGSVTWVSCVNADGTVNPEFIEDKIAPLYVGSQFQNPASLNPDGTYADRLIPVWPTVKVYVGVVSGDGLTYCDYSLKGSVGTELKVGAYDRKPVEFVLKSWLNKNNLVVNADNTVIKYKDLMDILDKVVDNYGESDNTFENGYTTEITISNVKEDLENGLEYKNLKVLVNPCDDATNGYRRVNGSAVNGTGETVLITGAEIGDSFTVKFSQNYGSASLEVNFTVGADKDAYINVAHPYQNVDWY